MRFPVIPSIFLALLLITGAVLVPNIAPLLPEKQVLVARLNAQSGLQLAVKGEVRLRFLPRPQVILNEVTLRSEMEAEQHLRAEKLIVNLSALDLVQNPLTVQGITLLRADSELVLSDGVGGFIERLTQITHPGIRFIDSKFSLRGLRAYDAAHAVSVAHISLDLPARDAGDDLRVTLRQEVAGRPETVFRGRLGNMGARRQGLHISLQFAANERISFDGFLRQSAQEWRADGEMRVDSDAMISALAQTHFPLALAQAAQRVAFSGLVQFDGTGARSENLEITALDTVFQSRLALDWPQAAGERPVLTGRLSTGVLNLDNLSAAAKSDDEKTSTISTIWQAFERQLGVALRLEATRFDVGGESGQNLLLAFDWQDDKIDVQRLSLNLPFRSLFLAKGLLDVGENGPSFNGSFSTRSTDALAAGLWLGNLAGIDSSKLVERLDESQLQRVSLVGDIGWSPDAIELKAVSGRLADDRLSADINLALGEALRGQLDVQFERLDLADWGAVNGAAENDPSVITALLVPLNAFFETVLKSADTDRNLRLNISAETLFSGVNNYGAVNLTAQISNQMLRLQNLALSDQRGVNVQIDGLMHYDAASPYGEMSARMKGEGNLPPFLTALLPMQTPAMPRLDYNAEWLLTAPGSDDWPNTTLRGNGILGDIETSFVLQGPARQISFDAAGQRLELSMRGSAPNLARLFNFKQPYDPSKTGSLLLKMENQSSTIAQISGDLSLDQDRLVLLGSVRRGATGRRIEGALSYDLADVLPLVMAMDADQKMALKGTAQITSDNESFAFSGLNAMIGNGQVSGEGVVDFVADQPKLTANIKAENLNLSWVLPHLGKNGWSQEAMQWPVFARADLDVELAGTAISLGRLNLQQLVARVKLLDGVMEVPEITGRALGGDFAGSLVAEGGSLTPYFNVQLRLSDMDPSPVLAEIFANNPVQTRFGGTLNLSSRGTSPRAMMGALNGNMQLDLAAGQLLFVDMAAFQAVTQASDFVGAAEPYVKPVADDTASRFMRGVGLIEVQNGRANQVNVDFVFEPSVASRDGRFDAQVDFVSGDMLGDFTLYPAQNNKKLVWDLSGTLGAPNIALDASDFDIALPVENAPSVVAPSLE